MGKEAQSQVAGARARKEESEWTWGCGGDLHGLYQLVDKGGHDQYAALPQDSFCYERHLHPACTTNLFGEGKGRET